MKSALDLNCFCTKFQNNNGLDKPSLSNKPKCLVQEWVKGRTTFFFYPWKPRVDVKLSFLLMGLMQIQFLVYICHIQDTCLRPTARTLTRGALLGGRLALQSAVRGAAVPWLQWRPLSTSARHRSVCAKLACRLQAVHRWLWE